MFLSVGLFFGILFYTSFFYIVKKSSKGLEVLFWPIFIILMIAEAKESMLFTGYSSRLMLILLGFWASERKSAFKRSQGLVFRKVKCAPN